MKKHWEVKRLGEVCDFINRGISPKYHEKGGVGVCVINQKCIRDHRVNYDLARRHDYDAKMVSSERFIQVGDVLVNSTGTGTLGRVAQVRETPPEKTTVDSHITIVRPAQDKFYQDFFGYALIVIEEAIKESGEGCGGQTELARSVLSSNFSVSFPTSIPEQQRIVAILDEAFAAIATAKKNAEKNLQNARELFESYLQSVFANPGEGWEVKRLGKLGVITSSKRIFKSDYVKTGVPFYRTKEIKELAHGKEISLELFISQDIYNEIKNKFGIPISGDILLSAVGTIGEMYVVREGDEFYFKDGNIVWLKDFNSVDTYYLKYALTSLVEQIKKLSIGSAYNALTIEKLNEYSVPIATLPEQRSIVAKLDVLSAETKKLESIYRQKLADLEELKKSVLQKAFNGDI